MPIPPAIAPMKRLKIKREPSNPSERRVDPCAAASSLAFLIPTIARSPCPNAPATTPIATSCNNSFPGTPTPNALYCVKKENFFQARPVPKYIQRLISLLSTPKNSHPYVEVPILERHRQLCRILPYIDESCRNRLLLLHSDDQIFSVGLRFALYESQKSEMYQQQLISSHFANSQLSNVAKRITLYLIQRYLCLQVVNLINCVFRYFGW